VSFIKTGVEVRPLLKTEYLRLMRRAFVEYIKTGLVGTDEDRLKKLMERISRKVKEDKVNYVSK